MTPFQELIELFFNNDYVLCVTQEARKTSNSLPIRYVLGNYKTLHQTFFVWKRTVLIKHFFVQFHII